MKTILTLLCLAAVCARAEIVAGPITNSANGHIYFLLGQANWTESQAQAAALGGNLVTINDQAENDWVFQTFGSYGGAPRALWIGLTDRNNEGTFTWVSGEVSSFRSWSLVQPDNGGIGGEVEHYTHFWFPNFNGDGPTDGKWNDLPDIDSVHGVPVHGVVEIVPGALQPVVRDGSLCWQTVHGVTYQAQWKPANSKGKWVNFGRPVWGSGGEACVEGTPRAGHNRIYRVVILE